MASIEAAAAYALRISSITRFWGNELSNNVKRMTSMKVDAARALLVRDELAQVVAKCEEQARSLGKLKTQKAVLEKINASLRADLDKERCNRLFLITLF